MGLSCFSRPAVADDSVQGAARRNRAPADAAERDPLSDQQQHQQQQPLSPVRSGLSAAAAAAAMPALDLSTAAAAAVSEPMAQLSARFYRLLSPEGSPDRDGAPLQRAAESLCGSFISARSDSLSDAGSWTSGASSLSSACFAALAFALSLLL